MPLSLISSILRQPKISRVRTPTLLQMEATECGAASSGNYSKLLLAHSLAELWRECGVSREGSNALNVIKAAKNAE
jgi:ATP-binding cassette, subfamily C, bacterial